MVIKIAKALEVDPPESLLISIGRIPPDRTDLQELLREAYKLTGFGVLELRDDAVRKQGEKGARNLINKFLYRGVK
jgi:hypothetical protein